MGKHRLFLVLGVLAAATWLGSANAGSTCSQGWGASREERLLAMRSTSRTSPMSARTCSPPIRLLEEMGQDVGALGATADLLYVETFAHEDANRDGLPDHDAAWPGRVVTYLGSLELTAGLVPLVPTFDVMEPFQDQDGDGFCDAGEPFLDLSRDGSWGVNVPMTPARITAAVSGLPGGLVRGIAVYRNADTSAAEWEALLNSHPR